MKSPCATSVPVNLAAHIHNGELDVQRLERTVTTAVRMLDNVIDINYYACPTARNSNLGIARWAWA